MEEYILIKRDKNKKEHLYTFDNFKDANYNSYLMKTQEKDIEYLEVTKKELYKNILTGVTADLYFYGRDINGRYSYRVETLDLSDNRLIYLGTYDYCMDMAANLDFTNFKEIMIYRIYHIKLAKAHENDPVRIHYQNRALAKLDDMSYIKKDLEN